MSTKLTRRHRTMWMCENHLSQLNSSFSHLSPCLLNHMLPHTQYTRAESFSFFAFTGIVTHIISFYRTAAKYCMSFTFSRPQNHSSNSTLFFCLWTPRVLLVIRVRGKQVSEYTSQQHERNESRGTRLHVSLLLRTGRILQWLPLSFTSLLSLLSCQLAITLTSF